jgi:hypothetical protein
MSPMSNLEKDQQRMSPEAAEALSKVHRLIQETEARLAELFPSTNPVKSLFHRKFNCGWDCVPKMERAYPPLRELVYFLFQASTETIFPPNTPESKEVRRVVMQFRERLYLYEYKMHNHRTFHISRLWGACRDFEERVTYLHFGEQRYRDHLIRTGHGDQEIEDIIPRSVSSISGD